MTTTAPPQNRPLPEAVILIHVLQSPMNGRLATTPVVLKAVVVALERALLFAAKMMALSLTLTYVHSQSLKSQKLAILIHAPLITLIAGKRGAMALALKLVGEASKLVRFSA